MFTSKGTKTVNALAVSEKGGELAPFTYESKECSPFEVRVKISHCGICHSDLHLIDNDWNNATYPLVPGHEIIGEIIEAGSSVLKVKVGDVVGIGWQGDSCHTCEFCSAGEDHNCRQQKSSCLDQYGGFAEQIVMQSHFAFKIPNALPKEYAGPLLCGGATVFTPFVDHNINGMHKVGVIGIGGLGHMAIQFAKGFGCEITAFSSSDNKEIEAKSFGAHHFVTAGSSANLKKLTATFDFILATSSAAIDWNLYLSLLKPKGKLILLGAPPGNFTASMFSLISGSRLLAGSNIAGPVNMQKMLEFAAFHNVRPMIEIFPMSAANEALSKLRKNQIHYRAVLTNEL